MFSLRIKDWCVRYFIASIRRSIIQSSPLEAEKNVHASLIAGASLGEARSKIKQSADPGRKTRLQ